VDENTVRLIYDGIVVLALDRRFQSPAAVGRPGFPELAGLAFAAAGLEPIAQEVEAELRGCPVGDVAAVRAVPFIIRQLHVNDARAQAERFIDGPHPVAIPAGEI